MNATVFANGLLPEGQHRHALAADLGVPVTDVYALLKRFGRDVAGALVVSVDEPIVRLGDVVPYSAESLEEEIASLPEHPLGIHDDSELSIAGLQDKLLLVQLSDGTWGRPVHGRPSTHILKLDDRQRPGLVEAEAACLDLARRAGLTTIDSIVEVIGETTCLIVSRFDRAVLPGGSLRRIHQEDVCQALGRNPDAARGRGKYEDAGGPALKEVAALLDKYAADAQTELARLVALATFTVIVGNADAHGKNLALLHPTSETVELAPLYDTVPTALWPRLRADGAMSVNGRWRQSAITVDDLVAEARSWKFDPRRSRAVVLETAELLNSAVRSTTHEGLAKLVSTRAEQLLNESA